MFKHRCQLRRWAACVVMLCLFGLGSGIANACLGRGVATHDAAAVEPQDVVDADCRSAASLNCHDFCEKSSMSLPQQKLSLDAGLAHAMPLRPTLTAMPVPTHAPPLPLRPYGEGGLAPPAITLTLLRLAL